MTTLRFIICTSNIILDLFDELNEILFDWLHFWLIFVAFFQNLLLCPSVKFLLVYFVTFLAVHLLQFKFKWFFSLVFFTSNWMFHCMHPSFFLPGMFPTTCTHTYAHIVSFFTFILCYALYFVWWAMNVSVILSFDVSICSQNA